MKRVSIRSYRFAVIGFGLLWCCGAVQAANIPAWWHTRGLVNTNLVKNDYAPANIGQLKNVAYQTWVEVTNRLAQVGINTNETDPQVGANTTGYLSKWNGSALVSGTIFDNGNVGIGTTSPEYNLHVVGSLKVGNGSGQSDRDVNMIRIGDGDYIRIGEWEADDVLSFKASRYNFSNGNVGIGTNSPQAKLDVAGTVKATGAVIDGGSSLNGQTIINGNSWLNGGTTINGNSWLNGQTTINGNSWLNGDAYIRDRAFIGGGLSWSDVKLSVGGPVVIGSTCWTGMKLSVDGDSYIHGNLWVKTLSIMGGSDLAEPFNVSAEEEISVEPGMVMVIDAENPGQLKVSDQAYDRCVAGIVSGAGGIHPGMMMSQDGSIAAGEHPIALTGRVYCRADATGRPIQPGDLLTTSDLPGHAMATDYEQGQGAIIGKAMSALNEGTGLVLVLVSLQ